MRRSFFADFVALGGMATDQLPCASVYACIIVDELEIHGCRDSRRSDPFGSQKTMDEL